MNVLVDTHAFLWWITDDRRLPQSLHDAFSAGAHIAWLSAASIWEAEIKAATGRLDLGADLVTEAAAAGFKPLPINFEHAVAAARLPPLHRDPFDRMLVAQAQVEGLTLVTRDRRVAQYGAPVLWD